MPHWRPRQRLSCAATCPTPNAAYPCSVLPRAACRADRFLRQITDPARSHATHATTRTPQRARPNAGVEALATISRLGPRRRALCAHTLVACSRVDLQAPPAAPSDAPSPAKSPAKKACARNCSFRPRTIARPIRNYCTSVLRPSRGRCVLAPLNRRPCPRQAGTTALGAQEAVGLLLLHLRPLRDPNQKREDWPARGAVTTAATAATATTVTTVTTRRLANPRCCYYRCTVTTGTTVTTVATGQYSSRTRRQADPRFQENSLEPHPSTSARPPILPLPCAGADAE